MFVDDGTGQRVPFVRWTNTDTGEYVALREGSDGNPTGEQYRGRSIGALRFVPWGGAIKITSSKLTNDELMNGLEQYEKLFRWVLKFRETANKHIEEKWRERRLRPHG